MSSVCSMISLEPLLSSVVQAPLRSPQNLLQPTQNSRWSWLGSACATARAPVQGEATSVGTQAVCTVPTNKSRQFVMSSVCSMISLERAVCTVPKNKSRQFVMSSVCSKISLEPLLSSVVQAPLRSPQNLLQPIQTSWWSWPALLSSLQSVLL